jgi:hypothetical protein
MKLFAVIVADRKNEWIEFTLAETQERAEENILSDRQGISVEYVAEVPTIESLTKGK